MAGEWRTPMSFVDEPRQDWSRPELPALRDLLVLAYPTVSGARDLADTADLYPGTFPIEADLRAIWTQLIRVLGLQGQLRKLIEVAAADATTAGYNRSFREMLEDDPPLVPRASSAADWRSDEVRLDKLQRQRLMERRSRLMDIELAAGVVAAARSVARLTLWFGATRIRGTGFLISPDLLLTNEHNVFDPEQVPLTRAVAEFDYDRTPHDKPLVRKVDVAPVAANRADDWAVLRLTAAPGRPPLALGTPFDIGVNDLVVIIQHPLGTFKQFALEPLAIREVTATQLRYIADTQDGSSGSPVFNEHMHVVALHCAESSCELTVDGQPQTVWRNEGIRIDRVMSGLRAREIQFATNS
jgi:S1-C subfamily serine protease